MSHQSKIVSIEKLGQQYVITVECCGKHSIKHTVAASVLADKAKDTTRAQSLELAHKLVAEHCEHMETADAAIEGLMGNTYDHS